ncbi:MAG: HEPN domain-containing protein, partial [Prevotella sp.]|nr:HEPN domain-containing protein [Prevotella sp.]
MSLNDEERRTIVNLQMEKANRFLAQAEMVREMQQWDLAANRYYYACFHAVQALFIHNGLASKTHSGMLRQFGLHFIKTGIIEDR